MNPYICLAVLFLFGLLFFLMENRRSHQDLQKNEYTIHSDKIPLSFDSKKIAFLSDLHNNELGTGNEKIFAMLEREKPDYVFVGGDMIVSKLGNEVGAALPFLKELARRYPVYCGNGNHEARLLWREEGCPASGETYRSYIAELKNAGIRHLCNDRMEIRENQEVILLSEVELPHCFYKKLSHYEMPNTFMEESIGAADKERFHILFAHNPAYFKEYAKWGADLTLSGHVHGGIMRLPILGGVIAPSYHLFPKYDGGEYRIGDKRMIVSVGLGSHSIKIRLFNPPKIDFITLRSKR